MSRLPAFLLCVFVLLLGPAWASQFEFAVANTTAEEDAVQATIVVTRADTTAAASVGWRAGNGTAKAPGDFTAATGTLDFAAGEAMKTFPVAIVDDALAENGETINLSLEAPSAGATLGKRKRATLTIAFNDGVGVLQFGAPVFSAKEKGTALIPVTRTSGTAGTVSVHFSTADGTATAGADYTTTEGTLVFPPKSKRKTIKVPITADAVADGGETVLLNLDSPSGFATLGALDGAVLAIAEQRLALAPKAIRPGQVLTLKGKFDPAQAVFVQFSDYAGNETRIRAHGVTAKKAKVRVPVFFAPGGWELAAVQLGAQTEQGATVLGPAANQMIAAAMEPEDPVGTYTIEFLKGVQAVCALARQRWGDIAGQSAGGVDAVVMQTQLAACESALLTLQTSIEAIVAGTSASLPLGTAGTRPLTLDTDGLAFLDRMLAAAFLEGAPLAPAKRGLTDPLDAFRDALNADLAPNLAALFAQCDRLATIIDTAAAKADELARDGAANDDANDAAAAALVLAHTLTPALAGLVADCFAEPFIELEAGRAITLDDYAVAFDRIRQHVALSYVIELKARLHATALPAANADLTLGDFVAQFFDEADAIFGLLDVNDAASLIRAAFTHATTIFANRPLPTLTIADTVVNEPVTGTTTARFLVTLSRKSSVPVTVQFATAAGSATTADFAAATGTLTFPKNTVAKFVTVTVKSDATTEPDEEFFVNLTAPAGATLTADAQGRAVIHDISRIWTVAGEIKVEAPAPIGTQTYPFSEQQIPLPRNGGTKTFPVPGYGTVRVRITATQVTVTGSGSGGIPGSTCTGSANGGGPISETATQFEASGTISGTLNCTIAGNPVTVPISGEFTATAPK